CDAADALRVQRDQAVLPEQTAESLADPDHLPAAPHCGQHDCPDHGVETGRVAAARAHRNPADLPLCHRPAIPVPVNSSPAAPMSRMAARISPRPHAVNTPDASPAAIILAARRVVHYI